MMKKTIKNLINFKIVQNFPDENKIGIKGFCEDILLVIVFLKFLIFFGKVRKRV